MTPRYKTLLRTLLGAILQSNLSARDLSHLSEELRRGQLSDELAFLLDMMSNHFREEQRLGSSKGNLKEAEDVIKRKRLPKETVVNIIRSIDQDASYGVSRNLTMRDILQRFFAETTEKKADQLVEVLNSSGDSDPYLKGISDTRK